MRYTFTYLLESTIMSKYPKILFLLLSFLQTEIKAQSTVYNLTDAVSISTINDKIFESWASPTTVIIRRTGGLKALTIPITITGTATFCVDYGASPVGSSVTMPMGSREIWIRLRPDADELTEGNETIIITLQTSTAYTIAGSSFVEITLADKKVLPDDEEASRFLIQAGFGADPDELAQVKSLGFEAWINQQLTRPKGYLQPVIIAKRALGQPIYHPATKIALWTQFMRRRNPPSGGTVNTDILRQRIAYSLLQIFVISQNVDILANNSEGVTHYYDRLMDGALGNFRDLLLDVTLHPCMGVYLSHLGNVKPDPVNNIFPDENYAREIMQLFTIGLWELNQDGTRKLLSGQPIPTYTNADITQFARVFTGLHFGGPTNADTTSINTNQDFINLMRSHESFHDINPKTLLNGMMLGANRTTMQDVSSAIDNLFNHPNTGPFIGRLLIQRLVTSNPSPEYIGRIAAKFANNGSGVRGDMGAVVKAILLDTEARSYEKTEESTFGKMREPYMTLMNMAKTFNAQPSGGDYENATYLYDFYLQEPFQSPSVFNFYSPNYRPPGEVTSLGKFAPEFQILTAVTALEAQNNLFMSIRYTLGRWGNVEDSTQAIIFNFSEELPLANNPDALIRLLSRKLIGGVLKPRSFQIIREALVKMPLSGTTWQKDRVDMAAYLIGSSAEFNIQK